MQVTVNINKLKNGVYGDNT